jgi:NarL family two-component system response regulator LiaR
MPEESIRVMIVDDHAVVRSGLGTFLSAFSDLELVGDAPSGEAALALLDRYQPDVVLMDLMMPGLDGVQTTRAIRERNPRIQVIVLTSFGDQKLVQQALEAGAISYLMKDVSHRELGEAIRKAHRGQPSLSPEATQALIRAATRPPELGHDLTPREREVLAALVEGLSNPEIAELLIIGESTVKSHVTNIMGKLGVSNRTEAVALAIKHGLVE